MAGEGGRSEARRVSAPEVRGRKAVQCTGVKEIVLQRGEESFRATDGSFVPARCEP